MSIFLTYNLETIDQKLSQTLFQVNKLKSYKTLACVEMRGLKICQLDKKLKKKIIEVFNAQFLVVFSASCGS